MAHGLFRPYAISALGGFSPGSFQPYVSGRLIETVRYIIYNRVMAFGSCQNFRRLIFILLLDIKMLTTITILIFTKTYAVLS